MSPMQMPDFTNSVQVIKVAFGRFQMALTLVDQNGPTFFFHKMLFPAEHKARLEAQAARIQAELDAGADGMLFNPNLWYTPDADKPKLSVFKPKTA
jgi:hypothetical protein